VATGDEEGSGGHWRRRRNRKRPAWTVRPGPRGRAAERRWPVCSAGSCRGGQVVGAGVGSIAEDCRWRPRTRMRPCIVGTKVEPRSMLASASTSSRMRLGSLSELVAGSCRGHRDLIATPWRHSSNDLPGAGWRSLPTPRRGCDFLSPRLRPLPIQSPCPFAHHRADVGEVEVDADGGMP